ncbi:MAG: hypothetical protein KBT44_00930 [Bacteroidales bacterium]|nr:hypothetical protein [Candidatus Equibacterium intestinale]
MGCTSFLNVESIGKSTIETFFQDVTGLQAAGVGLHRELLEFYDDDFLSTSLSLTLLQVFQRLMS